VAESSGSDAIRGGGGTRDGSGGSVARWGTARRPGGYI
jgi:hypothetical protein